MYGWMDDAGSKLSLGLPCGCVPLGSILGQSIPYCSLFNKVTNILVLYFRLPKLENMHSWDSPACISPVAVANSGPCTQSPNVEVPNPNSAVSRTWTNSNINTVCTTLELSRKRKITCYSKGKVL